MNIMQVLTDAGLNAFGAQLFAESYLKSQLAAQALARGEPVKFFMPIQRSDCAGWRGVEISIAAVPAIETLGAAAEKLAQLGDQQELFTAVSNMLRDADGLAAAAEALNSALNAYTEALEAVTCSEDDDTVIALDAAESELSERQRAVMSRVHYYGRRAERVRAAVTEYQSGAAAEKLAQLGDQHAD